MQYNPRGPKSLMFKGRAGNLRFMGGASGPLPTKNQRERVGGEALNPFPWVLRRQEAILTPNNSAIPSPTLKIKSVGPLGRVHMGCGLSQVPSQATAISRPWRQGGGRSPPPFPVGFWEAGGRLDPQGSVISGPTLKHNRF